MSRAQQPSIRSFFQPRRAPEYVAPPSNAPPRDVTSTTAAAITPASPPPPAPPPPQTAAPVTVPVTLPPKGIPVLPSPPSLPSGATIVPLQEHHVPALRRINSLLLPVPYPDSFYAKALEPLASGLFSRAILWQDSDTDTPKIIGGLICRLEPNHFLDAQGRPLAHPPQPSSRRKPEDIALDTPYHAIYIQSLALLSPYRSLGLAAAALEHIIASATLLPAAGSSIDARTVYAHVWTENEDGLRWYEARDFQRDPEPVKGYYFKLRPDTAWIVRRHIGPSSALTATSPRAAAPTAASATAFTDAGAHGAGGVLTAAINLPPISTTPPSVSAPPALPSQTAAAAAAAALHPGANGLNGSSQATAPSLSPAPPSPLLAPPPRRPHPLPPHSLSPPPAPPAAVTRGATPLAPSPAPSTTSTRSTKSALSFQNTRPQTEWNDLPDDMVTHPQPTTQPQAAQQTTPSGGSTDITGHATGDVTGSGPGSGSRAGSGATSGASSRSSSAAARKRKERAYPSAAFGR